VTAICSSLIAGFEQNLPKPSIAVA